MDFSANKGEWSEIYALFKLLGEGEVFAGDANLNKLDVYYPIVDIIRRESLRRDYRPDRHARIVVMSEEGKEFLRVDMKQFLNEAEALLKQIKCATTPSFEVPSAERFMRCLRCEKVKMGSQDKADIQIVIHDLRTGMRPELGFSIKSQLGNPSTLINASKVTNILFKLRGKELSDDEIARINAVKGQEDRMEAVKQAGCTVEYEDVEHETFKNNLLFLDCCMPQFVGECLLTEHVSGETNLQRVVEKVAERNPFCYSGGNCGTFYAHKIKCC